MPEPDVHLSFDDCATGIKAALSSRYDGESIPALATAPPTCATGYDGSGQSVSFDGESRLRFAAHAALDLRCDATISLHIQTGENPHFIGAFGRWMLNDQFALFLDQGTWRFELVSPDSALAECSSGDQALEPYGSHFRLETLASSDWVHLVVVVECGKQATLYIDAQPAARLPLPQSFIFYPSDAPFLVGSVHEGDEKPYFIGAMDELRIYHRALNGEQLQALSCAH